MPIELLDARELDRAWTGLDFDDSAWGHAAVIRVSHDGGLAESRPPVDPYGAMLPRGIGMLGGQRVVPVAALLQTAPTGDMAAAAHGLPDHPAERLISHLRAVGPATQVSLPLTVTRDPGTATVVTVDFGRIVAGHVELDVDASVGYGWTCGIRRPPTTTPRPGRWRRRRGPAPATPPAAGRTGTGPSTSTACAVSPCSSRQATQGRSPSGRSR